jgi:hypothetical protein
MRNQPGFYRQPSVDSGRGRHPDLDDNGNLRPEALVWSDPEERDFNTRFANDQGFAGHFMDRVGERQAQLPVYVQEQVAGHTFGAGQGTYAGFREYQQKIDELNADEDRYTYGANTIVVRDHELEAMPMSRYEELFTDNGQPRPGVVLERTNRSIRLNDGIDPHSARELRNR